MKRSSVLMRILLTALFCVLLLAGTLVHAQEATSEPAAVSTEVPTGGVTTLVLLLGLGAVFLVGAGMIARSNFKQDAK
ncbi:MAG: hypothetical protein U0694_25560 [Anaerolineae bacterium]